MKPICLSYFAGGGGFSLGAKQAGCDVIGVELDELISRLYSLNVGECLNKDVLDLSFQELFQLIPTASERKRTGQRLIWQLSPPCQTDSVANTKGVVRPDASILSELLLHETVIQPDVIIVENVRGYLNNPSYVSFREAMRSRGYLIKEELLNAADFGVPQDRLRAITLMAREQLQNLNKKILNKNDWVGWDKATADISLPRAVLTDAQKKAVEAWVAARPLLIERVGYRGSPRCREGWRPAPTLKACAFDDGKGGTRSAVYTILRESGAYNATIPFLARLQGFPDWYRWSGSNALDGRVIGNAVPIVMAQCIVQAIVGTWDYSVAA